MIPAGKAGPEETWPEPLIDSVRHLPPHSNILVALSGGLDSVILLHSAARILRSSGKLTALHVNHQLQPNALETEGFCQRLCESLSVPLRTIRVEVSASPRGNGAGTGGLEEAAREARYQAFQSCLNDGDLLLMAHHGDDQSETLLFRLLRGTGVAGLGGIPVSRTLGKGVLHRPFLDFSRQQLEVWAKEQGVDWIEDPSNLDQRFDRNFLRQSIIPALKDRWPFLNRRIASTASACRESEEIARSLASIHFSRCGTADGGLHLSSFAQLSLAEQKNLIRWWVGQWNYLPPNPADWSGLLSGFLDSGADRQPEYVGDGYVIRRYQNRLFLVTRQSLPGEQGARVLPGQETVWGNWQLWLQAVSENSGPAPGLQVFVRQGGERIRPQTDGPSKSLKNWLQEQSVPPWERNDIPLVMAADGPERGGQTLVAVGHLWVAEQYCGGSPTSGWRLILKRDSD